MEQGKSSSYIARANGYHTLVDRVRNPTAMIGRRRGSDGDKVVIEGGETWRVGKQDKGGGGARRPDMFEDGGRTRGWRRRHVDDAHKRRDISGVSNASGTHRTT